jgi:hypothetical protein
MSSPTGDGKVNADNDYHSIDPRYGSLSTSVYSC